MNYVCISVLAGVDYDNTTLTATFTAGSIIATVRISITDDTVVDEGDEAFNLLLNLIPTTDIRVNLGTSSNATAVIIDTSTYIRMYIHIHNNG